MWDARDPSPRLVEYVWLMLRVGGKSVTLEYNLVPGLANSTRWQGGEKKRLGIRTTTTQSVGRYLYTYSITMKEQYYSRHGRQARVPFRS